MYKRVLGVIIALLQVFVATSFDSVDSWPQICLKQELFDGADSRNLPDQDGNTQGGGGGTFDEVKGTMQVSMNGSKRQIHDKYIRYTMSER